LPAGIANMAPVFSGRIPWLKNWKTPMDFGLSYRGKRILGNSKRWRGVVFGTGLASLSAVIIFSSLYDSDLLSEHLWLIAITGALIGFGALMGDAIESFFKRRIGIKPGDSWFPFDQIDYIIGGILLSSPIVQWPPEIIVWIFVLYFGLHVIVSYIGFLLGLKDKPI
jgi:CDP-2,3-bis-(O-geranylgeranyl)-sn-glycerol synthase